MLEHWRHAGPLVAISGVTLASLYINLFYLWTVKMRSAAASREATPMGEKRRQGVIRFGLFNTLSCCRYVNDLNILGNYC